jgi:hypothetical protein
MQNLGSRLRLMIDRHPSITLPDFQMPNDEQVHLAAETFRLLADPIRVKILWALLPGEANVVGLAAYA